MQDSLDQLQTLVLGIRAAVLLIVHAALRGPRRCTRLRRKALQPADWVLMWLDALLTLASRQLYLMQLDVVAEEALLATLAHDILIHTPTVLFVRAVEQEHFSTAMCAGCLSLLARATVTKVFGNAAYVAMTALALRHVWIAATKLMEPMEPIEPPRSRPLVV